MTYAEYEEKLNSVITNPDSAPDTVLGVLSAIKDDLNSLDSATANIAELNDRIDGLQKTNVNLYQQITGSVIEEEKEPAWQDLEGEEALDAFVEQLGKENSDG